MTAPSSTPTDALDAFLSLTPLVPGEDEAAYHALRASVVNHLQPANPMEAICARDVVDVSWELQRHTKLHAHCLARSRVGAMRRILAEGLARGSDTHKARMKLASRWEAGDLVALVHVDELLARKGYDSERVIVEAYDESLPTLDALDRMIARLELRRTRLLREIDRCRAFALRLRASLKQVTREPPPGAARQEQDRDLGPPPSRSRPLHAPETPILTPPAQDERLGRRPETVTAESEDQGAGLAVMPAMSRTRRPSSLVRATGRPAPSGEEPSAPTRSRPFPSLEDA